MNMGRIFSIIKLGIKYLWRYRRRYYFLLAALVFGFTIVSFITSAKDGMYSSAYYSAQSHYAGDIVAVGYNSLSDGNFSHYLSQNEITAILSAAELSELNPQYTVFRTFFSGAVVHFNGNSIELKYLTGCDWENEQHLFNNMSFDEQPVPFMEDEGIVLSVPVAKQLGAKTGDSIILELETQSGQKNTARLIINGIVKDTSIFAWYKAYISRVALNRLIAYNENDCSTIGFFLANPASAEKGRMRLQRFLSAQAQTGPLVYNRDEMIHERDIPWNGIRIFLYTLPVYLSEISYLLDAMNIITYFLYVMMLLIILASAGVTYRLILHERSKEMGVMRVIGFFGTDLRLVLWTEIFVLGLISIACGFFLSRLLSLAVSRMSFAWFPGFEIFLKDGRLTALYQPGTMLFNAALLLFILFILALIPSFKVSRKELPGLLSGEPL